MSILIKNQDMPPEGEKYLLEIQHDGTVYDAIGQRVAAHAVQADSPWHRVEEPPKQSGAFAVACVYDGKLYWSKGIYLNGKWLREGAGIEMQADYWMPVPEPPKEENNGSSRKEASSDL